MWSLEVEDLVAGIGGGAAPPILSHVSFSMSAGERVALVGPSGAGKTSLVRLIMGLDEPVRRRSGRVRLGGEDVHAIGRRRLRDLRRRVLGFVPQNPASGFDPLKTLAWQWAQNLATIDDPTQRDAAQLYLAAFGIEGRLQAYPHAWSRGMLQRLLVAMALARRPRLLIMDEPTSALDPVLAAEVMAETARTAARQDTAILLITHHRGLANAFATRRLTLDRGRLLSTAESAAVTTSTHAPRDADCATGATRQAGADTPVLEARELTVELGGRRVLDGVSLTLHHGECVAVIGESGAGKTTLVRTVLGLERATAGRITLGVERPGLVFQDPLGALNPAMRADAAVAEPLVAQGVHPAEAIAQARALARRLGLDDAQLEQRTHQLSVGQAQRVAIARALVCNARLIVLDEPLSALDHDTAQDVTGMIRGIRDAFGPAMLVVTHDLGFAARIADRVVVLRHGRHVETAAAAAFFERPATEYGRALLSAARSLGDVGRGEHR